jgi:hypothetical protein
MDFQFLPDMGRMNGQWPSVERTHCSRAATRAENWASVASLIETCKLNRVDPQRYFTDLLTRLVNGWPQARIDELMPWCWADAKNHLTSRPNIQGH